MLRPINHLVYIFIMLYITCVNALFKLVQKKIIQVYSVLLQTNKVAINIFPFFIKNIIISTLSAENLNSFFTKIKDHTDIYTIRQVNFNIFHKFWVVLTNNKVKYYNELNRTKALESEISNFFYKTNVDSHKYNVTLFYFFNKMILVNTPYVYWRYISAYAHNSETNSKSNHIRTELFFMFINTLKTIEKSKLTFVKVTFNTFKGVSNFFKNDVQNIKFLTYSIVQKNAVEVNNYSTTSVDLFKKYSKLVNTDKYKHPLLNLVVANAQAFRGRTFMIAANSVKTLQQNLTIFWYNKVHNTTIDVASKTLILYLRAARHFNKGRYSRNRQLYRTGVYWCIWLNVVVVYALHYYFYRVVFSFGYLWLPFCVMVLSIFSSRLYKYRYYSANQIVIEVKEYINFLFYFFLKVQLYITTRCLTIKSYFLTFFKNYLTLITNFIESLSIILKNLFK